MLTSSPSRLIPSLDRLLRQNAADRAVGCYGRPLVVETLRSVLDEQRARLQKDPGAGIMSDEALIDECCGRLQALSRASLQPVFNLTGTVLHTNLGRALFPRAAVDAAVAAMTRPVNLEFDLAGGVRGERDHHVEKWLKRFTGAEAAVVVNNNAAAVFLVLNSLAQRKEVIVSRGELVEIGGSFRIPDIMQRAGCKLREVGTTNRTHKHDFEAAIGPRTAAILKVHASNYEIKGFTAAVAETELAAIARAWNVPLINDLGSGMLINLEKHGLPHEATPQEAIAQGADIVTFSGDKLLGGPQCGLIVGRKDLIAKIRKNPLRRILRLDKVRLAALEAVLRLYADPERLSAELPTLRLLTRTPAEILAQAQRIIPAVAAALAGHADAAVIECASQVGSGARPTDTVPSVGIALTSQKKRSAAPELAAAFRKLPVPVLGYIREGQFILDLRCLEPEQEAEFVAQLGQLPLLKKSA
jgi:L-seryl-tRNA(Ser) seleniumtransferase